MLRFVLNIELIERINDNDTSDAVLLRRRSCFREAKGKRP